MKRLLRLLTVASVVATTSAQTFNTNYVLGLQKSFPTGEDEQINVTSGLAFDPTSQNGGVYDRVYLANRSSDNAKRGLYSVDIVNETSSSRLALAGDGSNDLDRPTGLAVDSSGNAYLTYGIVPSVWKVMDPSDVARPSSKRFFCLSSCFLSD